MRRINVYITAVLLVLLVVYLLLLDTLAKPIFESQATEEYGAEVSVESLSISPFVGKITLNGLQVADRRNAMRNLAQADRAYVDIDMVKLVQDIIEVDELEIDGLVTLKRRQSPAEILRPLLPENSDIANAGLPTFELPNTNALIEQQRELLLADIADIKGTIGGKETKWQAKMAELPGAADVTAYKERIRQLKGKKGLNQLSALPELQKIYAEVNRDLENIENMKAEFRGDIQIIRNQLDLAAALPAKYTNDLIDSLGLSSGQMAQLGNRVLRGDFSGLTQQVLAPLAYNASGQVNAEDSMPIFIRHATINGPILPSAAGFSAQGQLQDFAWPLELADLPAILKLEGASLDGGSMLIDAIIDHRSSPSDMFKVAIDKLPLRHMLLKGSDQLAIEVDQTLASINGELSIDGEALSGEFTQHFTQTLFKTALSDNAGDAAVLIARVLENSTEFMMEMSFAGTLMSPELSFKADMDDLIAETLEQAISQRVQSLTADLQNEMSAEIGPEIASAREQFSSLESLQGQLQNSLQGLTGLQ